MFHQHTSLGALRVFEAAARLHSFKAAAEELNVTATAVSHQIRGLEQRLGSKLFIRGTRSIELTADGKKLAQVVHTALLQISDALEEITDNPTSLTICTPESFAAMWLVPRLERFNKKHPQITINIKTGDYCPDIHNDLRVDFGIRHTSDNQLHEHETMLAKEQLGLYASSRYLEKLATQDAVKIAQIKQHQQYSPDEGAIAGSTLQGKRLEFISVEKEHHALQLAISGQAIARISSTLAGYYIEQGLIEGSLLELVDTGASYRWYISPASKNLYKARIFNQWINESLAL